MLLWYWVMSSWYILDINLLLVISFANIFSHSVGCLFVLLMACFAVQKVLSLIRTHLFIFAFVSFAWGDRSKNILLWFMSKTFLPMFSSKSFMVSGLTFRILIYFEIIFVYNVRKCSNFILLHVLFQFSQQHLCYWRDCLFSIVYSCILCHRLINHRCVGSFLDSVFRVIDLCVCFCARTILFWLL